MADSSAIFSFFAPTRIHFGRGAAEMLGSVASGLGTSAFVVTGSHPQRIQPLISALGVSTTLFTVKDEPEISLVTEGASLALERGCDLVISIGGGSAIDAGKAISALMTNQGDIMSYLEVIGEGRPLVAPTAPFIAVPTTAGTGAEVTRNAVLFSKRHGVKVSMRSEGMLPDVAIVDPLLMTGVPPEVTAATGLDALAQVIEPFVSKKANPVTDALCESGMVRIARSLRTVFDDGQDLAGREDMAMASLFGGLALANAGLGAVHGFAGPMGGMFGISHGVICGRLLPLVFRENVDTARRIPWLRIRFDRVSQLLTGDPLGTAEDGIRWMEELCGYLRVPGFAAFGVKESHFDSIIEAARAASSMKGNPVMLTDAQLHRILLRAL